MSEESPLNSPQVDNSGAQSSKEDPNGEICRQSAPKLGSQKSGKKSTPSLQSKDQAGTAALSVHAVALGSIIADALKSSFEGLRDSMNAGFADLGNTLAA